MSDGTSGDPPIVLDNVMPDDSMDNRASELVGSQPVATIVAGRRLVLDLTVLISWIALTDWLLYRIGTHLAWALFFVSVSVIFAVLKRRTARLGPSILFAFALMMVATKLSWCGSWLQIVCGIGLVVSYSMSLSGVAPFLPELILFVWHVVSGAFTWLTHIRVRRSVPVGLVRDASNLSYAPGAVALPILCSLAFSTFFVLANPDLAKIMATYLHTGADWFRSVVGGVTFTQGIFWVISGWLVLGLLYPSATKSLSERPPRAKLEANESKRYSAFRNTLVSLISLYSIYLVFEFATLWGREFAPNFYYAGYAHEGAFWLTAALALATLLLSLFFRARTLADPRLVKLKRLAKIWSIANLLLAVAVYHRLFIYIDYNGMTRMRIIGMLGITCVVVGFGLVVIKVVRDHGFVWLIHRQLWVPFGAIVIFTVLPVDWIASRYNVSRVEAASLAPACQIISHRCSAEGILPLVELADHADPRIREGVRALLAMWADHLGVAPAIVLSNDMPSAQVGGKSSEGLRVTPWRSALGHQSPWFRGIAANSRSRLEPMRSDAALWNFQLSDKILKQALVNTSEKWSVYSLNPNARDEALNTFYRYTYQWY